MARPPESPTSRPDNRYSRFVAWVKVALPLAALALLSTLFLVPGDPGREAAEGPGGDELRRLMQKRLLRAPTYSAVTEEGGALTVTADTATPRDGDRDLFDVTDLAVAVDRADGGRATLSARSGVIDSRAQEGVFIGDILVQTSEGYVLRADRLEASLDGTRAVSPSPVRIEGPDLVIEAGHMQVGGGAEGTQAGRILFKDGVRLVYTPPEARPSDGPE